MRTSAQPPSRLQRRAERNLMGGPASGRRSDSAPQEAEVALARQGANRRSSTSPRPNRTAGAAALLQKPPVSASLPVPACPRIAAFANVASFFLLFSEGPSAPHALRWTDFRPQNTSLPTTSARRTAEVSSCLFIFPHCARTEMLTVDESSSRRAGRHPPTHVELTSIRHNVVRCGARRLRS